MKAAPGCWRVKDEWLSLLKLIIGPFFMARGRLDAGTAQAALIASNVPDDEASQSVWVCFQFGSLTTRCLSSVIGFKQNTSLFFMEPSSEDKRVFVLNGNQVIHVVYYSFYKIYCPI